MKKIIYKNLAKRTGYNVDGEPSENPSDETDFMNPAIPGGKYVVNYWEESNEFCADLTLYLSQYEGRSSSEISRDIMKIHAMNRELIPRLKEVTQFDENTIRRDNPGAVAEFYYYIPAENLSDVSNLERFLVETRKFMAERE